MSEDAHNGFNIEQWRKSFDAEMNALKSSVEMSSEQLKRLLSTPNTEDTRAQDCVFLWSIGVRADL